MDNGIEGGKGRGGEEVGETVVGIKNKLKK